MIKRYYDSYIHNLKSALDEVDFNTLDLIIKTLLDAHRGDKQVFIVGNGGSALTASHFACDLSKWSTSHDDEGVKRPRLY
jgi:D-sedoheptulose 7-phosphate isomerase